MFKSVGLLKLFMFLMWDIFDELGNKGCGLIVLCQVDKGSVELTSLMSTWHTNELSERREPQLRNCIHKIKL